MSWSIFGGSLFHSTASSEWHVDLLWSALSNGAGISLGATVGESVGTTEGHAVLGAPVSLEPLRIDGYAVEGRNVGESVDVGTTVGTSVGVTVG